MVQAVSADAGNPHVVGIEAEPRATKEQQLIDDSGRLNGPGAPGSLVGQLGITRDLGMRAYRDTRTRRVRVTPTFVGCYLRS